MRVLMLVLLLVPALAEASVDFKCESVNVRDQVGGWLHFGYAGANGSVQLESWTAYPPLSLLDADLDAGQAVAPGGVRFTSSADRGASALIDVPVLYLTNDKFTAKVALGGRKFDLVCVRH